MVEITLAALLTCIMIIAGAGLSLILLAMSASGNRGAWAVAAGDPGYVHLSTTSTGANPALHSQPYMPSG